MSRIPPEFAQDRAPWQRQNAVMRRYLLPALLLALPLLGACQNTTPMERGDHQFRLGNFPASLEAYEEAAAAEDDATEAEARIVRAKHFLMESYAVDLLHHGRPLDALDVLERITPQAPSDRQPVMTALQERSRKLHADQMNEAGYQAREESNPELAAELFLEALAWNPELESAQLRLAATEQQLATKARLGEEFYFEGMDHLREDQSIRARTSFMHAATLLGEDGLAQSRYEGLTEDLGEESFSAAMLYLEAGLLGQAWVAIQDAAHLRPDDEETKVQLDIIVARVKREALMTAGEVAVRGGRTDVADEVLKEILALGLTSKDPHLTDLSERNQDSKNRNRYGRARAYELDRQLLSAAALYQSILNDEAGFGWEDVELRLREIQSRLKDAEAAYARAMQAQEAGDQEAYREALSETVQASIDYADALQRLRELHLEQAALEANS